MEKHALTPSQAALAEMGENSPTIDYGDWVLNHWAALKTALSSHDALVEILQEIIDPPPPGWDLISAASLMDKARNILAKAHGEQ